MLKQFVSIKDKIDKPGHIIFNTQTRFYQPENNEHSGAVQRIRFVLCTIKDFDGLMRGYILNEQYEVITTKLLQFSTIDEFFSFANFITKNGFNLKVK